MLRRARRAWLAPIATAVCLTTAAPAARAQDAGAMAARGDSLFAAGDVWNAESVYYAAVRAEPRNPAARLALGRYLAARGALRIGTVLMEEARYFGGDPATVARELAPLYARLGDWRSLVALPSSPLSRAEQRRAAWLATNGRLTNGPDSASVAYVPAATGPTLGRVAARIGGDSVTLTIDPQVRGLELDAGIAGSGEGVRAFGANGDAGAPAVASSLSLGAVTVTNVPARLVAGLGARRGRIGLDLLGTLAPTFDPARGRMVLRRSGRLAEASGAERVATLVVSDRTYLVTSPPESLGSAAARARLAGRAWTLDPWRGEIRLAR